ncbi:MAG: OmpA family protein [Bacteroidetes bacterium]|nr:OmpA family protein [Bacteroidota bacterium]
MKKLILFFFLLFGIHCFAQKTFVNEIYFDSGKDSLSAASINVLGSFCKKIQAENKTFITISGYCDSIGDEKFNYDLSLQRAHAVEKYFLSQNIKTDSILVYGFGETKPKYSGKDWGKNRRVEISIKLIPIIKEIVKVVKVDTVIKPIIKKTIIASFIDTAKVGGTIALRNINFFNGSPIPLPEAKEPLNELLKVMQDNPSLEICIEGHICCTKGDPENLSGQRALTVFSFLTKNGIEKNRLSHKGFGHTKPLTRERNEEERQMNRRVEIRIVKK